MINIEGLMSQEQLKLSNYQAMSRRSRRSTLRKPSLEGQNKKSIRIQVNSKERGAGGLPTHIIEGQMEDCMSMSNSQVETHFSPDTPYGRICPDILPVI